MAPVQGEVFAYSLPVQKLLRFGVSSQSARTVNYRYYGIGPEHIPELLRMLQDEVLYRAQSNTPEAWTQTHAAHALAQFRAVEAIEPLLAFYRHDRDTLDLGWIREELPYLFERIGPAALPALEAALEDKANYDSNDLAVLASCVEEIGAFWPDVTERCKQILLRHLEAAATNDPEFNAFLISSLLNLHTAEAEPAIRRAYEIDRVDEQIVGPLEEVLRDLRHGSPSPYEIGQQVNDRIMNLDFGALKDGFEDDFGPDEPFFPPPLFGPAGSKPHGHTPREKAKERRKEARKAKKRNRKKK